jgi:hypothetical protein
MSRTPTIAEVLTAAIDARLADVHTSIPAKVVRYDAAQCLVDAAPLVRAPERQESGRVAYLPLPVVTNVPVAFPQGGGFRLTFPLAVGDTVWLSFSEASLERWLRFGGEVSPEDPRRFALSDAAAFPGVRALAGGDAVTAASTDGCVLELIGGDAKLRLKAGGTVELGTSGADALALASKVDGQLSALSSVLAAWVPVPGDGGTVLKTALTALQSGGWPAATASARVKTDS